MTGVELGYLISILSLIVASIVCFTNLRRNNSADDKKQSAEMTTVIVKLENINTGINEIAHVLSLLFFLDLVYPLM